MRTRKNGIIICGTDTDVGKTIASAFIVQGLNGTYWKPIQSGLEDETDSNKVCRILNLDKENILKEAYQFKQPVSPHWAAEQENIKIETDQLTIPESKNLIIIETAGGLLVPLNRHLLQIDQIISWGLPVILVARTVLGTLNHTLLSIEALKRRNISILGLILNGPAHKDNPKTLEQFGGVKIIAHLPVFKEINSTNLAKEWEKQKLQSTFKELLIR